ncbi:MAG: hypothetical protein J0L88_03720 [Xanthomonadales bacterium]|nr:hypothetical protein [Xanthomonadales bacterium]
MKHVLGAFQAMLVAGFVAVLLASSVHATDIKDGRAMVTPVKEDRFAIDAFTFGKAELFGYISDLKDTKKIKGIVLREKKGKAIASDEQKRIIGSIGNTLQLETFYQQGKELEPIVYKP